MIMDPFSLVQLSTQFWIRSFGIKDLRLKGTIWSLFGKLLFKPFELPLLVLMSLLNDHLNSRDRGISPNQFLWSCIDLWIREFRCLNFLDSSLQTCLSLIDLVELPALKEIHKSLNYASYILRRFQSKTHVLIDIKFVHTQRLLLIWALILH